MSRADCHAWDTEPNPIAHLRECDGLLKGLTSLLCDPNRAEAEGKIRDITLQIQSKIRWWTGSQSYMIDLSQEREFSQWARAQRSEEWILTKATILSHDGVEHGGFHFFRPSKSDENSNCLQIQYGDMWISALYWDRDTNEPTHSATFHLA